MRPLIFTCAQSASTDRLTNTCSLFHIIEDISVSSLPVSTPPMFVYAFLEKDPGDSDKAACVMRIYMDKDKITEMPMNVDFRGQPRTRMQSILRGLTISKSGILKFTLNVGNKEIGAWTIPVRRVESGAKAQPAAQAAVPPAPPPAPKAPPAKGKKKR